MRGARHLVWLALLASVPAAAMGAACPDTSGFQAVQDEVDVAVPCAGPRRRYVRDAKRRVRASELSKPCRKRFVRERIIQSTCGRAGVICCQRRGNALGRFRAKAKACKAPGTICPGASVGAACSPSGGCATTVTTTTTTTSTTTPGGCPAACPNDPAAAGAPKQLCLDVPLADSATRSNGSDLDTGFSGLSHNFPIPGGARLAYCLTNCDGAGDTLCDASGDTGAGSLNGETFGAPLPLLSASLPVCVVNRFQPGPITGTFDLASGAGGEGGGPGDSGKNPVNLFSDTYLRVGFPDVCPRCVVQGDNTAGALGKSGACSSTSSTPGAACVVDSFVTVAGAQGDPNYTLSTSCRPQGRPVGTLDIRLRLTTGSARSLPGPNPCSGVGQRTPDDCGVGGCTATCTGCPTQGPNGECIDPKGGIAQVCCANDTAKSCFPTRGGGTIDRSGARGTASALYASVFCIAATGSGSIDGVAGLPGPGALLLPSSPITVLRHTE